MSVLAAPQPQPQPAITYAVDTIMVTGNTPGGRVVLFGVSRTPMGVAAFTARRWRVQVADGTGTATFSLNDRLPASSIYAAVDVESGAYSIASPPGYPLRVKQFPMAALRKSGELYTALGLDRVGLQILCVRPKKGAWQIFTTDCSKSDKDGVCNGKILIDATSLEPLFTTKDDLKDFQQHDIVIVVDPMELDVLASEVGK